MGNGNGRRNARFNIGVFNIGGFKLLPFQVDVSRGNGSTPLNEGAAAKESYHHVLDVFHHHCLPTHYAESESDSESDSDLDSVANADGGIEAQSDTDADIEAQYKAKEDADMEHKSSANPNADPPDIIEGPSHSAGWSRLAALPAHIRMDGLLRQLIGTWRRTNPEGLIRRQSHTNPNADPPDIIQGRSHADPKSNAGWSRLARSLAYIRIDRLLWQLITKWRRTTPEDKPWSMPPAEELQEAGIKFERKGEEGIKFGRKGVEPAVSFLEVEFDEKGTLKIPYLYFGDDLQTIFQNLIAYEQFYPKAGTFFTGYARFMDHLINTAKHVQILRHAAILEHDLGSDDELARHFNEFRGWFFFQESTHLFKEFKAINYYCRKRWPTWRAKLMSNYFNSPWTILSLIAAVLLLLLTIAQTVFSII